MVRKSHIEYDVQAAQRRADEHTWDDVEWARQADVSVVTLRKWLNGDPSVKLRTVDDIVHPLGLAALDLIKKNGKKRA